MTDQTNENNSKISSDEIRYGRLLAEMEPQTTQGREIEMVEQTQTNNQTQTKDNKITKARSRVTTNTPA
jgi:hypothetical protein